MDYDAITFDTQTVERNGFHFDGGMLAQLKQFKNGPTDVVISEIVAKEILKHLIEKTRSAKDSLEAASKKAAEYGLIESAKPPFLEEPLDVKAIARARLTTFLQAIGAAIVPADRASIRELVDRYFSPVPPFSASGGKKSEFPDAIALLSLQAWAKTEGKKILAVSEDKDWLAFSRKSDEIEVVAELKDGLEKLQQHVDEANVVATQLLHDLTTDPDLKRGLFEHVANEVVDLDISINADSAYLVEPELSGITLLELSLSGEPDGIDFTVVQAGPLRLVVRAQAYLQVKIDASFSFSIYDSIDKDYVSMGSNDAHRDEEIEAALLLTFERDLPSTPFLLTQAEVIDPPSSVDFGTIEPDYGDDDYDGEWPEAPSNEPHGESDPQF